MNVHFVIHEPFEAPGAYETWVHQRGYTATYSRVYNGEPLPRSIEDIDLLLVMGGPQSTSTTREECPYFDSDAEQTLIAQCVASGRAVVGVCLGAQLIGEALGARCERSPEREIGLFPISLTKVGIKNKKFSHFGESLAVGHWHGDMPGLTKEAHVIAYSEGCPRQIIEYSALVYGFQCHMEFTLEVVDLLIAASKDEISSLGQHRFVQQPGVLRRNEYTTAHQKLFTFLDRLIEEYVSNR